MTTAIFIGDEITAAALRLAGATTRSPDFRDVPRVFDEALLGADLIIITAEHAQAISEDALRAAIRRADPLILVMPDGGNRRAPEDLEARVERVLGIEQ